MARKEIDNVRIIQWGNTLSKWEEINSQQGEHFQLKMNELGVVNNSSGKTLALVVGNNNDTVAELYENAISETSNTNVFFSGIGAGYNLPAATPTVLGGIKIDSEYFSMINQKLTPKLLTYAVPEPSGNYYNASGPTPENIALTLPSDHDLRVQGTVFAETLITTEEINVQVGFQYIDIHKKINKDDKYEVYLDNAIFIGTIEDKDTIINIFTHPLYDDCEVVVNSTSVNNGAFDIWYSYPNPADNSAQDVQEIVDGVTTNHWYSSLSYDTSDASRHKIKVSRAVAPFVNGAYYRVTNRRLVEKGEDVDTPMVLGDNEKAGIRLYNYHKDDASEENEARRRVAELSIDNNGFLWFSPNVYPTDWPENENITKNYRIPLVNPTGMENSLITINSNGMLVPKTSISTSELPTYYSLTITKNENRTEDNYVSVETVYDPFDSHKSVTINQHYCDTIIANGKEYKAIENKIDLGSPIWTEDLYNKLQTAVQTIKFNGTEYVGPNPEFNYTYSANINSGTLIDVQKDGERFTINHLQDAEYQDVIGYTQHLIGPNNESTIRVINTINRDNEKMGHVMDYKDYLVNFTPLLNYIKDLEQRIVDLENIINNL